MWDCVSYLKWPFLSVILSMVGALSAAAAATPAAAAASKFEATAAGVQLRPLQLQTLHQPAR